MSTFANPLTLEERASSATMLRDDAENIRLVLKGKCLRKNEIFSYRYSAELLKSAAESLASDHYSLSHISSGDFRILANLLPYSGLTPKAEKARQITYSIRTEGIIIKSNLGILFAMMRNLVKANFSAKTNASVHLSVFPFTGVVEDHLYLPPGVSDLGEYVAISVQDNTAGVCSTLEGRPTAGLARLASKCLRAPLAIESESGKASVVLYHPKNLV